MKHLFYIFVGGGLGSVLRFLISLYTQKLWKINDFPLGTFLVNSIGCFLIGYLSSVIKADHTTKFLLVTGFCGAFTTFSTFSLESYQLYQQGQLFTLIMYVALSFIIGFGMVFLGMNIAK